ncbi:hypothetical protein EDC45_1380 [Mesocricetibacter intestinalis]|uniref:Esterase n=1 Tax=Mesocricetibacter intestinalis TaxID=1521930 RepID=A0A4R6V8F0_9PAST|nr:alpha/beta fold hydrolase [Mesocricetibacter intestinalis]TDQ57732.1 hypothetical protein EDC45_1380 [Mesocricetibacter intestinalis]
MQKRLYITHGYTANSRSHWFPWLKRVLAKHNMLTTIFDMPDSHHPDPRQWLDYHRKHIEQCDENTIFVGHSLGCIATLSYLQTQYSNIAGVILVSGFDRTLPNLPELNPFLNPMPDYADLIERIPYRTVIAAADDPVVNCTYSEQLARHLQADYQLLASGGHFLDREGCTQLMPVYREVLKILG